MPNLTLAAIAANDSMWAEFETVWAKIMNGYSPKAQYVHMKEISGLSKGFSQHLGWNQDSAFGLANECLVYMSRLDKERFRMFYCCVDLQAWRKLRKETYQMPEPVEMCNYFCSEQVLEWYLKHYPGVVDVSSDTVKYFFDRGEAFEQPFKDKWNAERDRAEKNGEWSHWQLIEEVGSVEMKKTPGVQAADIVAWGVNRENIKQYGEKGQGLARLLREVIPSFYIEWDEDKMRQQFRPLLHCP